MGGVRQVERLQGDEDTSQKTADGGQKTGDRMESVKVQKIGN